MSKLKQLAEAVQAGYQKRELWAEVEKTIDQMTWVDFAVTYDKGTKFQDILLFQLICSPLQHLAESIIKKNPVFAAKIIDDRGYTALHHACGLPQEEALKIMSLLMPYMSHDEILSRSFNNRTFLHTAADRNYYKVASSISPELISIILKNICIYTPNAGIYIPLIKFLKDATHFYDSQISAYPELADNYFRKGVILHGIGKNEKAIKCYKKAIELDQSYAEKIEGIELDALTEQSSAANLQANPELMKSKINSLTQELSELNKKTILLSKELIQLRGALKITEEHKGERVDELPPYEEDAPPLPACLPEDLLLVGDTEVTFHA